MFFGGGDYFFNKSSVMFAFCREHTVNEREYQTVSSIFETLFEEVEPDVLEGGAERLGPIIKQTLHQVGNQVEVEKCEFCATGKGFGDGEFTNAGRTVEDDDFFHASILGKRFSIMALLPGTDKSACTE